MPTGYTAVDPYSIEYRSSHQEERSLLLQRQQSLILRLLSRTLGDIPSPLEAKICELSWEQLERLNEALLDFSNIEDLVAWVEGNSS